MRKFIFIILAVLFLLAVLYYLAWDGKKYEPETSVWEVEILSEEAYMCQVLSYGDLMGTLSSNIPNEIYTTIRSNLYYSGGYASYSDMHDTLEAQGVTYRIFCQPIAISTDELVPASIYVYCETDETDSTTKVTKIVGAHIQLDSDKTSGISGLMNIDSLTVSLEENTIQFSYSGSFYREAEEIGRFDIIDTESEDDNAVYRVSTHDAPYFTVEHEYTQTKTGRKAATCEFAGSIGVGQLPEKTIEIED